MHGAVEPEDQRIARLREKRRNLAANIRLLLGQLEKLEVEFEDAKRELQQATGRYSAPSSG